MRLLNTSTLKFVEVEKPENYAILSHKWSQKEGEEISFDEMERMEGSSALPTSQSLNDMFRALPTYHGWKTGYTKIQMCCQTAFNQGYQHIWIDTCCIDKKSSSELSEAINSMFQWYSNSDVCFAYLDDVPGGLSVTELSASFKQSRWFSRGWTLQELLAPRKLIFYSADWQSIGDREEWKDSIAEITNIHAAALSGDIARIKSYSVAQKMSWVGSRETKREEDVAYSLMGIFEVSMPLLYGEGRKAFIRLQEEIIKISDDQSIFFWDFLKSEEAAESGLLAPSPRCFRSSSDCIPYQFFAAAEPYTMSNAGLRIRGAIQKKSSEDYRLLLNCYEEGKPQRVIKLALRKLNSFGDQFTRRENALRYDTDLGIKPRLQTIYVRQEISALEMPKRDGRNLSFLLPQWSLERHGFVIDHVFPPEQFEKRYRPRICPPAFDTTWSVTNWTWHVLVALKYVIPSSSVIALIGYVGRGDICWCNLTTWDGKHHDAAEKWYSAAMQMQKATMSPTSSVQLEIRGRRHMLKMDLATTDSNRINVDMVLQDPTDDTPSFTFKASEAPGADSDESYLSSSCSEDEWSTSNEIQTLHTVQRHSDTYQSRSHERKARQALSGKAHISSTQESPLDKGPMPVQVSSLATALKGVTSSSLRTASKDSNQARERDWGCWTPEPSERKRERRTSRSSGSSEWERERRAPRASGSLRTEREIGRHEEAAFALQIKSIDELLFARRKHTGKNAMVKDVDDVGYENIVYRVSEEADVNKEQMHFHEYRIGPGSHIRPSHYAQRGSRENNRSKITRFREPEPRGKTRRSLRE